MVETAPSPQRSYEARLQPAGLGGGTVIWLVDPENPGPYGAFDVLSEDEQQRAMRFFRDVDRRQFIAAHVLLRVKLGEMLALPPRQVRFGLGPHGRPEVAPACDVSFSLSHTRGLVGCALARGVIVGLDLEPLRPLDALAMAPGILSETERQDVAARPEDEQWRRFLQYWTVKEATLKVRGTGLTLPADQAEIRWRGGTATSDSMPLAAQQPWVAAVPDASRPHGHRARLWRLVRS